GLGRRLRGKLRNGKLAGKSIRTEPVARFERLVVSFLGQPSLRLGFPHGEYRKAVDRMIAQSGRPPIDWEGDPFRPLGDPDPVPLADAIQEVRADLAASRRKAKQPPPAPAPRGLLSILLTPLAWLGLGGSRKSSKRKQKTDLPARGTT